MDEKLVDKEYICHLIDKISEKLKAEFAIPIGCWDDDIAEACAGTMESCVEALQEIKKMLS